MYEDENTLGEMGNAPGEAPEGQSSSPDVEQQARSMGWVPQEEYKGNGNWLDAETFVANKENLLPVLRGQNRKLEAQIARQQAELKALQANFQASQESIEQLKEVHAEATRIAVERAKAELKAQLRNAREEGDIDAEMAIREQMDTLTQQARAAEQQQRQAAQAQAQQPEQPALHPDWPAWQAENPWFGVDQRKTLRAMGIAQELRADPENDDLQGRAFFDRILEVMAERTGTPVGKVGGTRPSQSTQAAAGGTRGKSFADLPAEARAACDRQGRKLVGEGRAFKDMAAWRTYYTNLYFQG
ncbi:MAG: hypothetical protein AzoDbin1_05124 [Azoarcus sp.]|nr:hypothetical protein [Azoarcus sp.]